MMILLAPAKLSKLGEPIAEAAPAYPLSSLEKAVSLLDHHPITHVARQLRLDPTKLRKQRLAAHRSVLPNSSLAPHFLEVRASALSSGSGPTLTPDPSSPRLATEAALRLRIERTDGHCLTLSVPSSEWSRIEALYSLFLRA